MDGARESITRKEKNMGIKVTAFAFLLSSRALGVVKLTLDGGCNV
jgi:hypothetical protein